MLFTHLTALIDVIQQYVCCNICLFWPLDSVTGLSICSMPPRTFWWRNGWWKYKQTQVDIFISKLRYANKNLHWCDDDMIHADVFLFLQRPEWALIVDCTSWSRVPHLLVRYEGLTTSNSFPQIPKAPDPWNNGMMFPLPLCRKPSLCSSCHGLAKCHCPSQHDVISTFPRRKPPGAAQPKEIVVLARDFTHLPQSHLRSVDEQSTISSSDGGCCGEALCCVVQNYIYLSWMWSCSTFPLSRSDSSPSLHCWLLNIPTEPLVVRWCTHLWHLLIE